MRMKTFSRVAAIVFGLMMLTLCGIILAEIVLRKFFDFSFSGVEELTGYAIAASAPLCFMVAAVEQCHIRINLLHMRLPRVLQAGLNVLAWSCWPRSRARCSCSAYGRCIKHQRPARSPRRRGRHR